MTQFQRMVGVKRGYGQAPHNRGILHYREGMDVAEPWKDFIAELHGKAYDAFLRRMLGLGPDQQIILTMEWYYAWQGCSVSPHCDARRKLATHIFFFATDEDWPREWGGDILILDDEGRYKAHSAPDLRRSEGGGVAGPAQERQPAFPADGTFLARRAAAAIPRARTSTASFSSSR